ncbi:MAG: SDR family oxidoreductase [Pseudomonadota bacterium]
MPPAKPVDLHGRVAAITGGARGIGLAIARRLHAAGARVCIGDIDAALARQEAIALGGFAHELDVRSEDSFARFLWMTEEALGPVDILVNNAGIMPMGAFLDMPKALCTAQIDINLGGVMHGMHLALPGMLARRCGHVVNVASMAGRFALPGAAVYSATKHAVVALTEAVAGEHRDSGVQFSVIMPSKVLTELSSGTDSANPGIPAVTPEEVAAAVLATLRHPRLRVAVPDYLQTVHALYTLVPARLQEQGRRLFGDTGLLTRLDPTARDAYAQRLAEFSKPTRG